MAQLSLQIAEPVTPKGRKKKRKKGTGHPTNRPLKGYITADYDLKCQARDCTGLVHGGSKELCWKCRCKEHKTGERLPRKGENDARFKTVPSQAVKKLSG